MKKFKLEKKTEKQVCWECDGKGEVLRTSRGREARNEKCRSCDGSGIWEESRFIYIVGNQAIDADTTK